MHFWKTDLCTSGKKYLCTFGKRFVHIWKHICAHFGNRFVHIWKKICWGFCNLHLCRDGRIMMLVGGYLEVISGCKAAIRDYSSSSSRVRSKYIVSKCICSSRPTKVYLYPARPTTRLTAQYVGLNLLRWDRVLSKISVDEMIHVCYCTSFLETLRKNTLLKTVGHSF